MIPPNKLEQLADFQDAIQSEEGLERLRAMQYLQQMNNKGLLEMPQVTQQPIVERQEGGMTSPFKSNYGVRGNPVLDRYNPQYDLAGTTGDEIGLLKQKELEAQKNIMQQQLESNPNILENKIKAAEIIVNGGTDAELRQAQEIYRNNPEEVQRYINEIRMNPERAGGGQVFDAAQGLASLGRGGDNMLLHINPEELQGLSSILKITYNPITGLPEAFGGFKSFFKPFKQAAKAVKKVTKSKAFRTLAPLALTIAAPYLAASYFPSTFGVAGVTGGLGAKVAAMGPLAFGAATGIGSGLGALAAGAKPKDALQAAALGGVSAGAMRGFTNYMDPNIKSVFGPTYGGSGSQIAADPTAGKIGNLRTSFGEVGTPPPSFETPSGLDFGQYGKVDSLIDTYSPQYYGGDMAGAIPVDVPGGFTANIPSSMPPPDIIMKPGDISSISNFGGTGYDVGRSAVGVDPYEALYGTSPTTTQITPGPIETMSARLGPPANVDSYLTPLEYSPPSIQDQAIDALTDNKLVRTASNIPMGDYTLGDIGGAIVDDYSTGVGLGKLVATDAMIPDYQEQYAMEDERQRQLEELEKLGYSVDLSDADTGFGQTMVIRDASGTVMPSTLSIQDILDIAYGRRPRTRLVDRIDYAPATAKHGGLVNLAHGGGFSGKVEGDGHGMEDNVYMPIKEDGKQIGTLAVSPSEYVVDAYTMSALGNGNADEGAKIMDGVVESVRKKAYGTIRQPKEIDGLMALKPMMAGV
jgi:hypothetical protein